MNPGIGGFADNDGVVDDDTEHHQKGEQTDQIDGDAEQRQREQGAEEGGEQPGHDPERQFQAQEQRQDQEHQHRAHQQVFRHHVEPAFQVVGHVDHPVYLDTVGQTFLHPVHVVADFPGKGQRVLFAQGQYTDAHGGAAVMGQVVVVLDEAVADISDVAEQ